MVITTVINIYIITG